MTADEAAVETDVSALLREIQTLLDELIPHDAIHLKDGFDYVAHAWIRSELDRIFGLGNTREIILDGPKVVEDITYGQGRKVETACTLRLEIDVGEKMWVVEEVGSHIAQNNSTPHLVKVSYALKSARSDAMKRCAAVLGRRLGRDLYEDPWMLSYPSEDDCKAGIPKINRRHPHKEPGQKHQKDAFVSQVKAAGLRTADVIEFLVQEGVLESADTIEGIFAVSRVDKNTWNGLIYYADGDNGILTRCRQWLSAAEPFEAEVEYIKGFEPNVIDGHTRPGIPTAEFRDREKFPIQENDRARFMAKLREHGIEWGKEARDFKQYLYDLGILDGPKEDLLSLKASSVDGRTLLSMIAWTDTLVGGFNEVQAQA